MTYLITLYNIPYHVMTVIQQQLIQWMSGKCKNPPFSIHHIDHIYYIEYVVHFSCIQINVYNLLEICHNNYDMISLCV